MENSLDAIGQDVYIGDRVVFCYRGYDGKKADLQLGTVMKITDYGVWIKPDNPRYGRTYGYYDSKERIYKYKTDVSTYGLKWSSSKMIIKMGS